MSKQVWLTGITTSGTPHLGNYVGAIRPAVEASRNRDREGFYFLADYHALIKIRTPQCSSSRGRRFRQPGWLWDWTPTMPRFIGNRYPEILELTWMITCLTAKGLMNGPTRNKAVVQENLDSGANDADKGITMGLFSYPILMSADILMFKATHVPVGRDQIQHLEMARDIAQRFNHHYGDHLVLPDVVVEERASVLQGLDGRKMSKSYGNTIPLFESSKKLRKSIMKIKTNSQEPGEPKDPEGNTVFEIYRAFATEEQCDVLRQAYADGIAWGEAKQQLFELVDGVLAEPRKRYDELMADPSQIDAILAEGGEKARAHSRPYLDQLRRAVGVA